MSLFKYVESDPGGIVYKPDMKENEDTPSDSFLSVFDVYMPPLKGIDLLCSKTNYWIEDNMPLRLVTETKIESYTKLIFNNISPTSYIRNELIVNALDRHINADKFDTNLFVSFWGKREKRLQNLYVNNLFDFTVKPSSLHAELSFHKSNLGFLKEELGWLQTINYENRNEIVSSKKHLTLFDTPLSILINPLYEWAITLPQTTSQRNTHYCDLAHQFSLIYDRWSEIERDRFDSIMTNLQNWYKRVIKTTRKRVFGIQGIVYKFVSRDLRIFFRHIIQFLFKNMDDESDALFNNSNTRMKSYELLNRINVFKNEIIFKRKTYKALGSGYQI